MVSITTSCIINAPLERVVAYASDPDNAPHWYANIQSIEWKTPKPLQLGSQVAFVANFLGRRLAYTYEFTELALNQKLVMRTTEGPFAMQTAYIWKRVDENKTCMTIQNTGNPTGFAQLSAPFLSMAMKRANAKDLRKIKSILERVS